MNIEDKDDVREIHLGLRERLAYLGKVREQACNEPNNAAFFDLKIGRIKRLISSFPPL